MKSSSTAFPVMGVLVRLDRPARSTTNYQILLSDGKLIETVGDSEFKVGDCVQVFHGTDLTDITPEHNYVPARLERVKTC